LVELKVVRMARVKAVQWAAQLDVLKVAMKVVQLDWSAGYWADPRVALKVVHSVASMAVRMAAQTVDQWADRKAVLKAVSKAVLKAV
jgi:hypothetical protein